ncbi:MAG: hypothetical protein IPL61_17040 [Myxococcales bacterium]|nr:hypothetical protein [Myxococcales bacterium]
MRAQLGALLLVGAVLAGCGDGGDPTDPVDADTAHAGCTTLCQQRADCAGTELSASCVSECETSVAGVIRSDVFDPVTACFATLACGTDGDVCQVCTPTEAHVRFEAACRAVYGACLTGIDLEDRCLVVPGPTTEGGFAKCAITPAIIDELTACVPAGATCEAADACRLAVVRAHNLDLR